MVEWAVEVFGASFFIAWLGFIILGVVQVFLPAVAVAAHVLFLAAFFIRGYERTLLPILALVMAILELIGAPSEVLVVVSVEAIRLVVVFIEGTPFGLEEVKEILGSAILWQVWL